MLATPIELEPEEWKQFDFSMYRVSTHGRVFSRRTKKILKLHLNKSGYPCVKLSSTAEDGRDMTVRVHRMVAEAFIPNPYNLPTVNHLDGIKYNNFRSNLEWASHSRQMTHAVETGLLDTRKPSEGLVRLIRVFIGCGRSDADLALAYNLSVTTIASIRQRLAYTHVKKLNKLR